MSGVELFRVTVIAMTGSTFRVITEGTGQVPPAAAEIDVPPLLRRAADAIESDPDYLSGVSG